ncbi:hypothetical protein DE4576_03133 [Mycobacterium marinum]|nr:hypothetical protein DE4576_03133 [Mycobacterium marinum]
MFTKPFLAGFLGELAVPIKVAAVQLGLLLRAELAVAKFTQRCQLPKTQHVLGRGADEDRFVLEGTQRLEQLIVGHLWRADPLNGV